MEVRAVARDIRISPRKVRLVVDAVRGKRVGEAVAALRFMPQRAAVEVSKVIRSAAANAENNYGLEPDDLYVARIYADEGRTLKRFRARAHGRASPLLKRSSHITAIVSDAQPGLEVKEEA
ncbi:MAG: 50S ribosomal protein L22 [Chloroflexi bacterium]|nr:50S ribosomal protein L22 [Chloroflexota bacterium]